MIVYILASRGISFLLSPYGHPEPLIISARDMRMVRVILSTFRVISPPKIVSIEAMISSRLLSDVA